MSRHTLSCSRGDRHSASAHEPGLRYRIGRPLGKISRLRYRVELLLTVHNTFRCGQLSSPNPPSSPARPSTTTSSTTKRATRLNILQARPGTSHTATGRLQVATSERTWSTLVALFSRARPLSWPKSSHRHLSSKLEMVCLALPWYGFYAIPIVQLLIICIGHDQHCSADAREDTSRQHDHRVQDQAQRGALHRTPRTLQR